MAISRRKHNASSSNGGRNAKDRAHILLVEDHVATATAIQRYLEMCGFKVATAHSVKMALEVASADFDMLVTDLRLPDGTGWDLLERFKAKGPVKAIAMSGFSSPGDVLRSKEAGFADHLVKPLMPDELMAALKRLSKSEADEDED